MTNCLAKYRSKKGKCTVSLQELEEVSVTLSSIMEMQEYYVEVMGWMDRKDLVETAILEEILKAKLINSTLYAK